MHVIQYKRSDGRDADLKVYDSVHQMLADVSDSKDGRRKAAQYCQDAGWIGRRFESVDDVLDKASRSWSKGIELIEKMLADLSDAECPQPVDRRRRPRWSDSSGDELCHDRLRSGQDFWRETVRQRTVSPTATLTVFVDLSTSSCVDPDDMMWRGAAAIAITDKLESAGYRVELMLVQGSDIKWDGRFAQLSATCLKRPDDPVDIATLVNAISSWFYRTIMFGTWRARVNGRVETLGDNRAGQTLTPDRHDLSQVTPDEHYVYIHDVWTRGEALNRVRIELSRLAGQPVADFDGIN